MSTIDYEMSESLEVEAHLPLTDDEQRALNLYDKLQALQLEIAVINAQRRNQEVLHRDFTEDETKEMQGKLLQVRAKYALRNDVVEAVLLANPLLKAVHNGTDASPIERDLLPYVERRDEASVSVAKQASASGKLWDELTKVQGETLKASRKNVELTAELFQLAEEVKVKKLGRDDDPRTRRELEKLGDGIKSSRQRWRVVKGVASGIIAGSGVDWARDEQLLDIVLDPEIEE